MVKSVTFLVESIDPGLPGDDLLCAVCVSCLLSSHPVWTIEECVMVLYRCVMVQVAGGVCHSDICVCFETIGSLFITVYIFYGDNKYVNYLY